MKVQLNLAILHFRKKVQLKYLQETLENIVFVVDVNCFGFIGKISFLLNKPGAQSSRSIDTFHDSYQKQLSFNFPSFKTSKSSTKVSRICCETLFHSRKKVQSPKISSSCAMKNVTNMRSSNLRKSKQSNFFFHLYYQLQLTLLKETADSGLCRLSKSTFLNENDRKRGRSLRLNAEMEIFLSEAWREQIKVKNFI